MENPLYRAAMETQEQMALSGAPVEKQRENMDEATPFLKLTNIIDVELNIYKQDETNQEERIL